MKPSSRLVSPFVRAILSAICRIDSTELARVPAKGPLIVAMNHINFLEVPLVFTLLLPRPVVGLVKQETWDNFLLGHLADIWEAIAIDRAGTDLAAMRRSLEALEAGRILLLAPEGTRSGHGRLQKGHGGVVQLMARSGAPILPLAHFGGETFWDNLKGLRRTRFHLRVGEALSLQAPEGGFTRATRQAATDELMGHIARLMPERYRGYYADLPQGPDRYLRPLAP